MFRLAVSVSMFFGMFDCSAARELTSPLNEVVRRGDSSGEALLVGDMFTEFEGNIDARHGEPARFSDVFPNATLADLGRLSLVTVQKPNEVDYRVFEGANIESLRIVARQCADYLNTTSPRLGLGTCDEPGMAVLSARQLLELKNAERLDGFSLLLPDQETDDVFMDALNTLVLQHQPQTMSFGFAIPFCEIPSDINTVGLGVSLKNQSKESLELLFEAAGSAPPSQSELINTAHDQGIAATDGVTAIISDAGDFISFKNQGVVSLRSLQDKTCN